MKRKQPVLDESGDLMVVGTIGNWLKMYAEAEAKEMAKLHPGCKREVLIEAFLGGVGKTIYFLHLNPHIPPSAIAPAIMDYCDTRLPEVAVRIREAGKRQRSKKASNN